MCYNDFKDKKALRCRVKITSFGNGWESSVTSDGDIIFSDLAAVVNYEIDGDKCTLVYRDGLLEQRRNGSQNLHVTFREGSVTSLEIGSGGVCGSYRVYTKNIKYLSGKGGIRLTLGYESGEDREGITLVFTAALV